MLHPMGPGGFSPHLPFPPDFRPPFPGDFADFHHHQQQHHGGFHMVPLIPTCDFNPGGGQNNDVSAGLPYPSPPVGGGEFPSSSPHSSTSSLPSDFGGSADHCFPSPPLSDCSLPDYHVPPPSEPILC